VYSSALRSVGSLAPAGAVDVMRWSDSVSEFGLNRDELNTYNRHERRES